MLRPKIYTDYKEYVYLITTTDSKNLFDRLSVDPRVEYVTWCKGEWDLLLITTQQIDLSVNSELEHIIVYGERGNYVYPTVKRRTLTAALKDMHALLDDGNFIPSTLNDSLPERGEEWSDREESLFRYVKHDVRKPFLTIQRELDISRTLLLKCYERVRAHFLLVVPYFPLGFEAYAKFFLVMKSPYERQVIDILGQLPCQSTFFTVGDYLVAYTGIELHRGKVLLDLMSEMRSSGLVSSLGYAVPLIYHSR
jgi:hypothetical protein